MSTILVYGDSNSFGTPPLEQLGEDRRFSKSERWPAVMADHLGRDVDVIAEALPGRTTVHDDVIEGGARNGLAVLPAILHSHKPLDLVVLMLGTNDLKSRFSVTAWEISRSLERLVVDVRAAQPVAEICVIAPAYVKETGTLAEVFVGAEAKQTGLSKCISQMCERNHAHFLNANDHVTVSEIDGVHWDPDQHVNFGQVMADIVRGILREKS